MIDIVASFAEAFAFYNHGRLVEAETLYRAIIAEAPLHADSHHLLGLTLHRLGRDHAALESIQRAIALNEREPNYHNNLGTVYRSLGRCDEAIAAHRRALELKPDFASALSNLGIALQQQNRLAEAEQALEAALELQPHYVAALYNLGNLLTARGAHDEAIARYREALLLAPDHADALNNLGAALSEIGRADEAAECYRRVLALQPENAAAHNNLGNLLAQADALDEAARHFRRAIATEPRSVEARVNLGNALMIGGDPVAAHAAYREALMIDPQSESAHWNDGLALLIQGDLVTGFREWRWHAPAAQRFTAREWQGEPLDGATIFIHAEQGFGDVIQFARYLPLVAARGGRIIFEAPTELHRLFAGLNGAERIIAFGDRLPDFAWHCPLLSLPVVFGTSLASVPQRVPYLAAEPSAVVSWRKRLGGRELKVGLVWAGRPEHRRDRHRSLPLKELAPLFEITNVSFSALQKGEAALAQAQDLPDRMPLRLLSPWLDDFADTAAAIMAIDLVITVDTSVAHLAGALGKPVWILLPYACDWRWLEQRSDSPWYPTARLFRQDASRCWVPVIADVAEALAELASGASTAAFARLFQSA